MTYLAISVLSLVCSVALCASAYLRDRHILRSLVRDTVSVTTKGGETFKGIFWEADRRVTVLRSAVLMSSDGSNVITIGVDGELIIPTTEVAYMQRLASVTPA